MVSVFVLNRTMTIGWLDYSSAIGKQVTDAIHINDHLIKQP